MSRSEFATSIEQTLADIYWNVSDATWAPADSVESRMLDGLLWQFRTHMRAFTELINVLDQTASAAERVRSLDFVMSNLQAYNGFFPIEPRQNVPSLFSCIKDLWENPGTPEELKNRVKLWVQILKIDRSDDE